MSYMTSMTSYFFLENYNESQPQLINVATLPCKTKHSPSR